MIQPHDLPGSSNIIDIGAPIAKKKADGAEWKYRPYGHILQLDWQKQTMIGGLHLPQNMKKLPFYRVRVIACGPECKLVKPEDHVLIPAQMIQEATWDGNSAYFTGENQILAVVE